MTDQAVRVISPVVRGSGAIIVHRALADAMPGYELVSYDARWEYFPVLLPLLSCRDADLVHCTPEYAAYAVPGGKPLVVTFHNYVLDEFMRPYSSLLQRLHYRTDLLWAYRRAVKRAGAIVAVSEYTAGLVRQYLSPALPVQVIRNGVDASLFHPAGKTHPERGVRVLFSGNPCLRKGVDLLATIADRLAPDVTICVTGGLRGGLSSARRSNIDLIGKIAYSQMPGLYRDVDMLLMPTVREGLSLAVLEAMASGLPVVATDCSSLPEQIDHGKGGFLCVPGDVGDFAARANQLAADAGLRREMGEYNRARVEHQFVLGRMQEDYLRLFQQLK